MCFIVFCIHSIVWSNSSSLWQRTVALWCVLLRTCFDQPFHDLPLGKRHQRHRHQTWREEAGCGSRSGLEIVAVGPPCFWSFHWTCFILWYCTYVCKYVADSLYVHNIYDYFICCLLFCRLPSSNWSKRSFKFTTQWPHSQSSESFSLGRMKKRSSQRRCFAPAGPSKTARFLHPRQTKAATGRCVTWQSYNAPCRGEIWMAFRSCLDDSKLCSYCIRNRHRHIYIYRESFLGNNLKDLCHRTTFKMATKLWSVTLQGYLTVFSERCRTRDSRGKKHTRLSLGSWQPLPPWPLLEAAFAPSRFTWMKSQASTIGILCWSMPVVLSSRRWVMGLRVEEPRNGKAKLFESRSIDANASIKSCTWSPPCPVVLF